MDGDLCAVNPDVSGMGEVRIMLLKVGKRIKCREVRGTITAIVPAHTLGTKVWATAYIAQLDNGVGVVGSKYQFEVVRRVSKVR